MPAVGVGQREPCACAGGAAGGHSGDGKWATTIVGTAGERAGGRAAATVGERAAAAAEVRDAAGPKERARSGGGTSERVRDRGYVGHT